MSQGAIKSELLRNKQVQLFPGEYHVATGEVILSTLLGSCVAACLYDPIHQIVGMNHFMLANSGYPKTSPGLLADAGRYGIHAMELLVNKMLKCGALKKEIRAKVFGGGNVLSSLNGSSNLGSIGDINVRFIQEFLKKERIPLIAADLGGEQGRVIHFSSKDYSVHVRKVKSTVTKKVSNNELNFLAHSVKKNLKTTSELF